MTNKQPEALRQAVRDGKVVEFDDGLHGWHKSTLTDRPDTYLFYGNKQECYRIRHEPKPDRMRDKWLYEINDDDVLIPIAQFRIVQDGETGQLKSAEELPWSAYAPQRKMY